MYNIFADNKIEALWFRDLSIYLKDATIVKISKRGQNPTEIEKLILYDRPDIILCRNNIPFLVLEKTREVPTGHNVGQRMARLVQAAENGLITIYFLPYDAKKHGRNTNICNLNIRLLKAIIALASHTKSMVLAFNWICDSFNELIDDGTENASVKDFLSSVLIGTQGEIANKYLFYANEMNEDYNKRLVLNPIYANPPPSVEITDSMLNWKNNHYSLPDSKALIYKIEMEPNPKSLKRQDPYTGMQFLYYYLYCKQNISKTEDLKFCFYFPKITKILWTKTNPFNVNTKMSNWYLCADFFIFTDGVLKNNSKEIRTQLNLTIYNKQSINLSDKFLVPSFGTEEIVYLETKKYLKAKNYTILGGQPPKGCDHLPVIEVKDPAYLKKGSKGSFKPDLVVYKNKTVLLIECKPKYNHSDYIKLLQIKNSAGRKNAILDELDQRSIFKRNKINFNKDFIVEVGLAYSTDSQTNEPQSELKTFFISKQLPVKEFN